MEGILRKAAEIGIPLIAMLLIAVLSVLPCGLPDARGADLKPVRVVYFWPVQGFLLIPIVVGQKHGIYARYGLEVAIELPPDAQTTARVLAVGQADIAMEPRTDVVFAANIDLPLISIANYDQHNSWCRIAARRIGTRGIARSGIATSARAARMNLSKAVIGHRVTVQICFWVVALLLIIGLWQAVIVIGQIPHFVIPTPAATVDLLFSNAPMIGKLLWQTFKETLGGYAIGAAFGFMLAVGMSKLPLTGRLLYPALVTSQAVPIVGIAAPLVIIFGFGMTPKLIIVAWIVFFPVVVNVMDGLAQVDPDQINLARLLGGTRLRTFLIVELPACLGPLFSGLKIGASYAVTGAVIGEWTASSRMGLGTYLLSANAQMNTAGVYAAMMLMTLIGVGSFVSLLVIEYLATPWRHRATSPWRGTPLAPRQPR